MERKITIPKIFTFLLHQTNKSQKSQQRRLYMLNKRNTKPKALDQQLTKIIMTLNSSYAQQAKPS